MAVNTVHFDIMSARGSTIYQPQQRTRERLIADIYFGFTLLLETGENFRLQDAKGKDHFTFSLKGGNAPADQPEQFCIPWNPYVGDIDEAASKLETTGTLGLQTPDGMISKKPDGSEFASAGLEVPTGELKILDSVGTPRYVFHFMRNE